MAWAAIAGAGGGILSSLLDFFGNRGLRKAQKNQVELQNKMMNHILEMYPELKANMGYYGPLLKNLVAQFASGNVPNATPEFQRNLYNPQAAQISNAQQEALKNISQNMSRAGLNASSLFAKTYNDASTQGSMAKNQAYANAYTTTMGNKTNAMGLGAQLAGNQYNTSLSGIVGSQLGGANSAQSMYRAISANIPTSPWGALMGAGMSAFLPMLFGNKSNISGAVQMSPSLQRNMGGINTNWWSPDMATTSTPISEWNKWTGSAL